MADLARRAVTDRLGVAPDGHPETLPLVDAFLRQTVAEAAPTDRRQLTIAVGCYFGEVACRQLDGRWAPLGGDASGWRIELQRGRLWFSPVGMAGEVLCGCETPAYDGTLGVDEALRDELATLLAQAPPLAEAEYYSLAGRIEVLELAADWLARRSASRDDQADPGVTPPATTPG